MQRAQGQETAAAAPTTATRSLTPLAFFLSRGAADCDVTLRANDGTEHKAHWEALADRIQYFRAMRRSGMKEVKTGCVDVDADGKTVELLLRIVYGEEMQKLPLASLLPVMSLLASWVAFEVDVARYWDGNCGSSDVDAVWMIYGWATSKMASGAAVYEGAVECADWLRRREIPVGLEERLNAKVSRTGMWAIKLLVAAIDMNMGKEEDFAAPDFEAEEPSPDRINLRDDILGQWKEKWKAAGVKVNDKAAEKLIGLLKGEKGVTSAKISVTEAEELLGVAARLGLRMCWLGHWAVQQLDKRKEDSARCLLDLSGQLGNASMGVGILRGVHQKGEIFGKNYPLYRSPPIFGHTRPVVWDSCNSNNNGNTSVATRIALRTLFSLPCPKVPTKRTETIPGRRPAARKRILTSRNQASSDSGEEAVDEGDDSWEEGSAFGRSRRPRSVKKAACSQPLDV